MTLKFATALVIASIALCGGSAFGAPSPSLSTLLASTQWLNSRPTHADIKGKVVLVDFYTFECINCKHVQPNLRSLYHDDSRSDLVILSVHSPETPFERDVVNVRGSLSEQGVRWPVAIDNDFKLWNAYGVDAWPTQLIYDRHGVLRQTVVGEGQDEVVDATIHDLIAEK